MNHPHPDPIPDGEGDRLQPLSQGKLVQKKTGTELNSVPVGVGLNCWCTLLDVVENFFASELGDVAQFVFDTQQLVVLADAVGAAQGAGFDLSGVGGYGEIGDGGVFGFAATMGDYGGVTGAFGHLDSVEGFGEGADLVDLNQDRVGDFLIDAFFENFGVGDEEVVAN